MKFPDLFDTYSRKARLQPALLTIFPLFVSVAAWFPALYSWGAGLASLAVACGVTALFAHIARSRGRAVERRIFSKWGGKPTTKWLRHRDGNLDSHTRNRYHKFLEARVDGWTAPSESEERDDPERADAIYESAVLWLLEFTRDRERFPLVFKENVSYGFRRNTYGLRLDGLVISSACLIFNVFMTFDTWGMESNSAKGIGMVVFGLVAVIGWCFVASEAWVRDAADAYAKRLLASCDS